MILRSSAQLESPPVHDFFRLLGNHFPKGLEDCQIGFGLIRPDGLVVQADPKRIQKRFPLKLLHGIALISLLRGGGRFRISGENSSKQNECQNGSGESLNHDPVFLPHNFPVSFRLHIAFSGT